MLGMMLGRIDGCWGCCKKKDRKEGDDRVFVPEDAPNVHRGECG